MATNYLDQLPQFKQWILGNGKTDLTCYTYERQIIRFHAWLTEQGIELHDVLPRDINRYSLGLGVEAESRCQTIASIVSWYKFLLENADRDSLIKFNPAREISRPKKPKKIKNHFTDQMVIEIEARAKAEAVSGDWIAKRNYSMWRVFISTGIRRGEIKSLNIANLNKELRTIRVIGKGSKERSVDVEESDIQAVLAYLCERPEPRELDREALFTTRNHRRMSTRQINNVLDTVYKLAGYKFVEGRSMGVHATRHTHAIALTEELLKRNEPDTLRKVQSHLGHSSIQMSEIYIGMGVGVTKEESRLVSNRYATVPIPTENKPIIVCDDQNEAIGIAKQIMNSMPKPKEEPVQGELFI